MLCMLQEHEDNGRIIHSSVNASAIINRDTEGDVAMLQTLRERFCAVRV